MGIKRYILLMIVFIVALGLYVYSFQGGSYMLEFFGIPITLPIAVWIILPLIFTVIVTLLHMSYYSMKVYMSNRALMKDYETFIQSSRATLLGESYEPKFKTEWYKLPDEMLKAVKSPQEGAQKLNNEALREICSNISKINEGEHVDLKQYKLRNDNSLVIANRLNQLKNEPKIASEILRGCVDLDSFICSEAFKSLLENASYTEIKKYNYKLSPLDVLTLLRRHEDKEDDLTMQEEEIHSLMENTPLDKEQYVEAAKLLKRNINPDSLVAMYEKIYNKDNVAGKGYLYVLMELQMLDRAREVLLSSEEDEFKEFKTYLYLRDQGQNTDLKLLM